MNERQEENLHQLKIRVFQGAKKDQEYVDELSMLLASTFGPALISALLENGLELFRVRDENRAKRKKKKSHAKT